MALAALFPGGQGYGQTPSEAQEWQARGEWKRAEAAWRQLLAQDSGDYRLWASLGIVLAQERRFDEAIGAYRKALALKPRDGQTELNLGIAYFKSGRFAAAVTQLEEASKSTGETFQTDLLIGTALHAVQQYREAIPYLEKAANQQPNQPELARTLGEAYLYSGEYDRAMTVFKQLLLSEPDSAAAHVLLGEAYDASNREEAAIAEFREAARREYVPNAHFGLGYLLWKAHSYDEAKAEFEEELKHDPKNSQAMAYLGDIALKQGRQEQAEGFLRRSIGVRKDNAVAYLDLGTMETGQREYAAAERDLKRAIELDPKGADGHYRLAKLYQATGRRAEAAAEFAAVKKAHESETNDLVYKVSGKAGEKR